MADPNLIENERRKLSANSLNRLSTVCVAFGIVSVIAGYLHSIGSLRAAVPAWVLALGAIGWFILAVALHWLGRRLLRGLK